jgi:tetratricopeptide (TPR) repeat protein
MPITPIENKCLSRMDKLRHNLTVVENALDKLNRKEISLAQLKETFSSLDHIEQELRAFSKLGIPCVSEQGRFYSIKEKIEHNAKKIIAIFGSVKDYQAYRENKIVKIDPVWWRLDQVLAINNKKKTSHFFLITTIVLLVGIALTIGYKEFLAPDPTYVAMYGHQTKMNELLDAGLYEDALKEAEVCIDLMPDMPELIIAKAALLEEIGDGDSSEIYYDIALLRMDAYDFYSERSIFYLRMNNLEKLNQDAEYLMKFYPDNANGYYFQALSLENLGDKPSAIQMYEIAYEKAEANGDFEQAAMIKIRLATLMQQISF